MGFREYRRHRRVDWAEESRKSARAQARGFWYSLLAFAAALVALVAIKATHPALPLGRPIFALAGLAGGTLLIALIASRKGKRR